MKTLNFSANSHAMILSMVSIMIDSGIEPSISFRMGGWVNGLEGRTNCPEAIVAFMILTTLRTDLRLMGIMNDLMAGKRIGDVDLDIVNTFSMTYRKTLEDSHVVDGDGLSQVELHCDGKGTSNAQVFMMFAYIHEHKEVKLFYDILLPTFPDVVDMSDDQPIHSSDVEDTIDLQSLLNNI